jgi:hypothetical protein
MMGSLGVCVITVGCVYLLWRGILKIHVLRRVEDNWKEKRENGPRVKYNLQVEPTLLTMADIGCGSSGRV